MKMLCWEYGIEVERRRREVAPGGAYICGKSRDI
jgi:hypothetical protein